MFTNIKKIKGKYVIQKTIYGQSINYGTFDTKEEALKQKQLLIKYNWIKNKSTGYKKEEHFPRYCIRQNNQDKYIIKNRKTGHTYGAYKSKKYANIIKKILPFYTDNIKIERIEQQALEEFYRYISYDSRVGYYRFRYNNITIITSKSLTVILEERDLYLKCGGDEEAMCDITERYIYQEKNLPPFQKTENIVYEEKYKYKYLLRKQIRNHRIRIGRYNTYSLALLVKEYLDNKGWKLDDVNHIINITMEIQNRNKNIIKKDNRYYIRHDTKTKREYYGSYENIHLARYVRNKLRQDNWNKNKTKEYEAEYNYNKKNLYYYDRTDLFAID